jgi:hypothetical protein
MFGADPLMAVPDRNRLRRLEKALRAVGKSVEVHENSPDDAGNMVWLFCNTRVTACENPATIKIRPVIQMTYARDRGTP